MKSWIVVGLSMASGALVSVVVSRTMVREAVPPARAEQVASSRPVLADDDRPRSALEQHIDAMRAAAQHNAGDAGEGGGAAAADAAHVEPPADYPTEEEARAHNRELHAAKRASIQAQPADPAWAPVARTRFSSDLDALGATVDTIDCRTSACVATLEWPSRTQAQQEYRQLVEATYQLPCDRQIFLDQAVGDGLYRAELLLDCEHVRASDN
jgi:hypothetical protein